MRRPRVTASARRRRSVGVGLLLAAVVAAIGVPTSATAATGTVVHGQVTAAGKPLAGVPVGFWARTGKRITATTTSRTGRFTLRVPSRTLGFAYAGATPGSTKPLFTSGGTTYVRGVIGAATPSGVAPALYQGYRAATANGLDGGRTIRFRLQRAGRITTHDQHSTGFVISNLAGGTPGGATAQDGTATSNWLVPGTYRFAATATPPWRGVSRVLQVQTGTHTVASGIVHGATLSGRLTLPDGSPVTEQVPVQLLRNGTVVASTASTASGTYELPVGLAAGDYSLRIGAGRAPQPSDFEDSGHIPVTLHWTAQTVVPEDATPVSVPSGASTVMKDVVLAAAGSVTATAPGAGTMWLEDADGVMLARAGAAADGTFTFGGIVPGRAYRVVARSGGSGTQGGETVTWGESDAIVGKAGVTALGTIPLTGTPLQVYGAARGADHGSVLLTDPTEVLLRASTTVHDGSWYVVPGLVPGVYRVTASVDGVRSTTTTVHVTGDSAETSASVQARGAAAGLTMRFVSGSAPAHSVFGRLDGPDGLAVVIPRRAGAATQVLAIDGDSAEPTLAPGTYTATGTVYSPTWGTSWGSPAESSPWWFTAPTFRTTLRPGQQRSVTFALHVRGG